MVLNNVLFVLDDNQLSFIERRAFTLADLMVYRKVCQTEFIENMHFSEGGCIKLKKLTVECVQNAKLNKNVIIC